MSKKTQIRDFASRAEWALRERGEYRMQNDEPGLASAVREHLQRDYPKAHIALDTPSFGGEAVFRSDDHLGFKGPTS